MWRAAGVSDRYEKRELLKKIVPSFS